MKETYIKEKYEMDPLNGPMEEKHENGLMKDTDDKKLTTETYDRDPLKRPIKET